MDEDDLRNLEENLRQMEIDIHEKIESLKEECVQVF
jgi:hypothetical protein